MSKTIIINRLFPFTFLVVVMMIAGCGKNANQHPTTDVPLVILDTDIGSSTDDLFSLEMLYRYEEPSQECHAAACRPLTTARIPD